MTKQEYCKKIGVPFVDPHLKWEIGHLLRYEDCLIRRNRKATAAALFGSKCQRCGYDKCPAALEFHHFEPGNKKFEIGTALSAMTKKNEKEQWELILQELCKCVLLCSNCHREVEQDDSDETYAWVTRTCSADLQAKAKELEKKYHRD